MEGSVSALLGTLAASQDPVEVETLAKWAGVPTDDVEELLAERWRAFIAESAVVGDEPRYTLYHASLRDYLTGRMDRANLLPAQARLIAELSRATTEAHRRIVEGYRQQCGSEWPTLIHDDYARRHLATHLAGAEQYAELFAFTAESNAWAEARYAKEESYGGYLNDLERAWGWAESEAGWSVGRQIRCALIESSIRSLAGNLSPNLLFVAVQTKLWSAARALAHVPQMPDEEQRAEALTRLAPLMPDDLKAEALQAARAIQSEYTRARALSGLAAHLPDDLKADAVKEALQAARAIQDEHWRAEALSGLAAHLPDDLKADAVKEALQAARAIQNEGARALSGLAAHLPDALKQEALREALQAVCKTETGDTRAELFDPIVATWKAIAFAGFEDARQAWPMLLRSSAQFTRPVLLNDLAALLPLIQHLGGQEAIGEMFAAMRDVGRWWP